MQEKDSVTKTKEHEDECKYRTWLGTTLTEICNSVGPWKFNTTPVKQSRYHDVLYKILADPQEQPISRDHAEEIAWDENHVRMPFAPKNLYRVKENGVDVLKPRWEIIKKALSEPITSSRDLELAIKKYNSQVPTLEGLHSFFLYVLEDEDTNDFFTHVLPGIIELALHLPELLPIDIPLLKKNQNKTISFSQVQVASLLANAFLCTFPWRKDMALSYPGVNFLRLFASNSLSRRQNCIAEKLKCICHYFRRILSKHPTGVITFERRHIPRNSMPRWDKLDKNLGNVKVHIDSSGTIEDNGLGFLQIDFANKNIGGGVLGYGCVQEEIRFVICPELIIGRLFTEQLGDNDAVVITGVERYSSYKGYGEDFKWAGDVIDETPFDEFRRRKTSIAVIDATHYLKPSDQFYPSAMLREVNKAYAGFYCREKHNLAPVATGNWGCGAFQGSPYLKAIIQLMACCASNRDLVYFSFGNEELRDNFYDMCVFLGNNRITVMQIWKFLSTFASAKLPQDRLYSYIQQCYFDSKKQSTLTNFFKNRHSIDFTIPSTSKKKENIEIKKTIEDNEADTSQNSSGSRSSMKRNDLEKREASRSSCLKSTNEVNSMEIQELSQCSDTSEDIIPSSQNTEEVSLDPKAFRTKKKLPNNHEEILSIMEAMDGKTRKTREEEVSPETLLSELDKVKKQKPNNADDVAIDISEDDELIMEVDDYASNICNLASQKKAYKKITDYFTKINKPA